MPAKKILKKKKKAAAPKKKAVVRATKAKPATPKKMELVGVVTHFFTSIKVAIIKFKKPVATGVQIGFRGATTEFNQALTSMQYDHKVITRALKGKEVGVKVPKRVREGDEVFIIS